MDNFGLENLVDRLHKRNNPVQKATYLNLLTEIEDRFFPKNPTEHQVRTRHLYQHLLYFLCCISENCEPTKKDYEAATMRRLVSCSLDELDSNMKVSFRAFVNEGDFCHIEFTIVGSASEAYMRIEIDTECVDKRDLKGADIVLKNLIQNMPLDKAVTVLEDVFGKDALAEV